MPIAHPLTIIESSTGRVRWVEGSFRCLIFAERPESETRAIPARSRFATGFGGIQFRSLTAHETVLVHSPADTTSAKCRIDFWRADTSAFWEDRATRAPAGRCPSSTLSLSVWPLVGIGRPLVPPGSRLVRSAATPCSSQGSQRISAVFDRYSPCPSIYVYWTCVGHRLPDLS
jgi:hypothetical protein